MINKFKEGFIFGCGVFLIACFIVGVVALEHYGIISWVELLL